MISVETVDDILFDLEGSRQAQFEPLLSPPPSPPVKTRPTVFTGDRNISCRLEPVRPPSPQELRRGAVMMRRCLDANMKRYGTLLQVEKLFPPDGDHGMLVVPACQILETELNERLLRPARLIGRRLAEGLREAGDVKQTALLDKWESGELPTTIGVCCIVLLACYRAVEKGDGEVARFLKYEFSEPYLAGCRGNRMGRALDKVRTEFRNPACHGTRTFDQASYASFVGMLTTCPSLNAFDATDVASDDGVLVSHLLYHTGGYLKRLRDEKKWTEEKEFRERCQQLLDLKRQKCKPELFGKRGDCPRCGRGREWDGERCMYCNHGF